MREVGTGSYHAGRRDIVNHVGRTQIAGPNSFRGLNDAPATRVSNRLRRFAPYTQEQHRLVQLPAKLSVAIQVIQHPGSTRQLERRVSEAKPHVGFPQLLLAMLPAGRRNPMDARKPKPLAFDVIGNAPKDFRLLAGLREAGQKAFQHQIVTEVSRPKKVVADEKFQQSSVNLSIPNPRSRQASMVHFSEIKRGILICLLNVSAMKSL
jgi:hypothetical protein